MRCGRVRGSSGDANTRFTGMFDSNGPFIRNMFIDRSDENYQGLFGYVGDPITGNNVIIKRLGVANIFVAGNKYTGGLVAYSDNIFLLKTSFYKYANNGSVGGTAKTPDELQDVNTYTDTNTVGLTNAWDFAGKLKNDIGMPTYCELTMQLTTGFLI